MQWIATFKKFRNVAAAAFVWVLNSILTALALVAMPIWIGVVVKNHEADLIKVIRLEASATPELRQIFKYLAGFLFLFGSRPRPWCMKVS